ncbi:hypothetical protein BDN71DRAFT_462108 [Pleurotus eryngii]|uniref:Serine-threonine/tyrosine-protein kinase catalytic domain-containing protein n=1 Tax=Pleurotus eryngii TaxID=5323 RepID=A0A9P5ZJ87_PLEER|nr:hypothetical protein BDN71DRAFT_462108 [Pleurotus eryngii]
MPPQINNVQKRAGTRRTNTIANSIRIFRGLEGLAELPYLSPLKPICSLAISILELAQTLRKLRDDHAELIDRIKQLALILDPGKNKARTIVTEVEDLERALTEIIAVLEAECRLGWFQRVRKSQELKDNILSCTAKLDAYIERFTVGSLLRIQHLLIKDQEEVQVLKYSDIHLERSFQSLSHATLFRGRTLHLPQPESLSRVVVKRYHQTDAAKRVYHADIELLQHIRHPNLHQLMATSMSTAKSSFLVLPEFEPGGVTAFIDRRLKGSGVNSFMAVLQVCQGIASGMQYLRTECSELHQSEMGACFQLANIVLTPNGRPIIGHNLILDAPTLAPEKMPLDLDAWLKNEFLNFINSITYGTLDLSDWNLLMARKEGRRASRLRLLEHFTSYAVPSFTHSTYLFDSLLESLESAYQRNELSFRTIRSVAVNLWSGAFVYRPTTPVNCVLGDIGYMREDGQFVVLTNASDLVGKGVAKFSSLDLKSTSGKTDQGSPDGSGVMRHQFGKTLYASIRRRKILEMFNSTRAAWNYFITKVKTLCEAFSTLELPLAITDLIFSKSIALN